MGQRSFYVCGLVQLCDKFVANENNPITGNAAVMGSVFKGTAQNSERRWVPCILMETEHAQWQERDHQGQGTGVL